MNHLRSQWRTAALLREAGKSVWEPPSGTVFYHGTTRSAAERIREEGFVLPTSPTGRGMDFGFAAYLVRDRRVARDYSRGGIVAFTLAPGTRILDLAYTLSEGITDQHWERIPSAEYRRIAESQGCHGVTVAARDFDDEPVAIFDVSRLEVMR